MCGIAGILAYGPDAPPVDKEELVRIRDAMAPRGPDGEGLWVSNDNRAGLSHRRLAVIDLTESAAQPMASASGRYRIVFNGEIYNYRELRSQLVRDGRQLVSHSDTEVLLALYEERGAGMVKSLRGMFAFGIHDLERGTIFLARDPFGIKPLYYADDGRTFRFASQVKALLKGGKVDRRASPAGHIGFYLWGHVPDPHTLFEKIKAIDAGSSLLVGPSGPVERDVFFSIGREYAAAKDNASHAPTEAISERLFAGLKDSVRYHMIADVPVGIFLSSGIDSTTLTAIGSEFADGLRTVTLGFKEYRGTEDDETPLAALVARRYGTSHRTEWVSRTDFAARLDELLEAMDQPSIDGVNTYFVSQAAAQGGMKVALSGIGGDELFGGYPSFREVPLVSKLLGASRRVPSIGRGFRRVSAPILKKFTSPKYAGLLEYGASFEGAYLLRRGLYMPWELPEFLDGDFVREGWCELGTLLRLEDSIHGVDGSFQKVSTLELGWYMRNQLLRDADWAGMAHSLEIRVPFVDVELFRLVAAAASGGRPPSKGEMAHAPANPLPEQVFTRRKTGFSVPVGDWLRHAEGGSAAPRGIRDWARRVLPSPERPRRSLALVSDAYGSHGGIAKFNRDFLKAASSYPGAGEVVAIPRLVSGPIGEVPSKVSFIASAAGSKYKYFLVLLQALATSGRFDVVICGHINLLPLAWFAQFISGGRLILVIHGIDAWKPTSNPAANRLVRQVDAVVSVSAVTGERFNAWAGLEPERIHVLPNSIDAANFGPRPKKETLIRKYSLKGKTVIMTLGRLASVERYKGVDEILEILPVLIERVPHLVYVIAGDGDDRARLKKKSENLGVGDRVVFTGYIPEELKCDYFNLADAFVMPGRGEGFGIVFLEAMACGVPVVGSIADGSREALRDGVLGDLVDPADPQDILRAILSALRRPREVPAGLEYFSYDNFERRVHRLMDRW